jgi:N-acetylglutamate synthase-like GNAT family acetyltransferase
MSGPELIITLATHRDAAGIRALLTQSRLPISDLVSSQPEFVVAHAGGELVGIGAIESLGAAGLLRSVAVIPPRRKSGLGRDIVQRLERLARKAGMHELILLTETAQPFFERLGYEVIDRGAAPAAVQASAEFTSLCPQSAVCMRKPLPASGASRG